MINLSEVAGEESTIVLDVTFLDENGDAVTPNAASWTLTNADGEVINTRQDVAISPLATTVHIVLSGADLSLSSDAATRYRRILTVRATYDSDIGSDLALTEQIEFYVQSMVAVT